MTDTVYKGIRGVLLKASLLFSSVDGMVASALMIPLLGSIMQEFPDASPVLLNQTISLPSLLMIPAILITGYLSRFISKKYMLMFGSFIFVASGFGSMYSPNLEALVIFRAFEGIGMGIVYPLAPSIIAHLFNGKERAQMIGWSNAVGGIFSFFLSIAAGYVALTNWRHAFYFYLIFVVVIVMQAILLPAFPPEKKDRSITQAAGFTVQKTRLGLPVYLTAGAMLIFMTVAMVNLYYVSIFVATEKMGNTAQVGLATSLITVASITMSFAFGYLFKHLKRYLALLGLVMFAFAYFVYSTAHSMPLIYIGSIFTGVGLGCMFPYMMTRVAQVASKPAKTMAVTLLSLSIYAGQFLSGYFTPWLGSLAESTRDVFTLAGKIFAAFAVFALIYIFVTQKYESKIIIGDNG
ncbi:MFS transporter [Dehalobacter sp. DCM]|uniref:MFS transporter n=1 Tax=Dehalobacter sp. DCM TaxID=2907827 RepID=UPI003081376A|nr:MFS transporter [Dehalobacter sp. DCM]